ncbi:MAG: sigma 54-interacting transcriptional regulator, partial [Oscillospiraceae bacterium]|nr:sigma 54-interacting transcriptional regulator [Oscillospiraceae bacterium]
NDSLLRNNAFVTMDCSVWLPETLDTMLFGNYTTRRDANACMAELAQGGTLYLRHVEALPFETQYKLLSLIRGKFLHNGSNQPVAANVRVIASTTVNLLAAVERGDFRSDLYYALTVLSIELLPLRRRREEIAPWADYYFSEWQERYKRYIHLTQDARRFMQEYDWPGNLDQLNSVCERIILLTEKRDVDAVFLKKQVQQIAPKRLPGTEKIVLYKDEKAVQITELLRKHQGNRDKVATELGVSKTTLWRYMKKYGIEQDYSY